MTDAEKRSLKSYLSNVLEPALSFNQSAADIWKEKKAATTGLNLDTAKGMHQYHTGKVEAFAAAIADFKELFAEDLAEGGE